MVEILGKPASEFTIDEARAIFRSDGQHAMAVERGGKRLKLMLELKRF